MSESTVTPDHRDAIEAIAAQLERLATTVRALIPERDPVAGLDYLPQLELYPDECPTCGPGCSCDIARPVVMWQRGTPDVRPAVSPR